MNHGHLEGPKLFVRLTKTLLQTPLLYEASTLIYGNCSLSAQMILPTPYAKRLEQMLAEFLTAQGHSPQMTTLVS